MYFGYTLSELAVFLAAAVVLIWAFWRILTKSRHSSSFFFWFVIVVTVLCLWGWRSGYAVYTYNKIKTVMFKPAFEP